MTDLRGREMYKGEGRGGEGRGGEGRGGEGRGGEGRGEEGRGGEGRGGELKIRISLWLVILYFHGWVPLTTFHWSLRKNGQKMTNAQQLLLGP